jgi:spermidine synthase
VVVAAQFLLLRASAAGVVYAKESAYQYVTVTERQDGSLALIFDAGFGIQSVRPVGLYTSQYWDYPAVLPAYLAPAETLNVLVLGAATSATERQLTRFWPEIDFSFTSVEIDPAVVRVAERYFDPPRRTVVTTDARTFAAQSEGTYDLIILDAYSREITVPFHLTTTEFFAQLRERLAPGGIIMINANASSADDLFIRSLARTLEQAIPVVSIVSVPDSCNRLLIASEKPLVEIADIPEAVAPLMPVMRQMAPAGTGGLVLTDNRSPSELLGLGALCGF